MKKYILIFATTLMVSYGFAQSIERSVLASSGNFSTSSTLSLSSTFGEVFVTTLNSSSIELTQGFQQSTPSSGGGSGGGIGISELNNSDFNVYPNPFENLITIKSNTKGNYSIAIFDVLGRSSNFNHNAINSESKLDLQLDLKNYQSGLYFLKIYDDNKHLKTIKIKKQ